MDLPPSAVPYRFLGSMENSKDSIVGSGRPFPLHPPEFGQHPRASPSFVILREAEIKITKTWEISRIPGQNPCVSELPLRFTLWDCISSMRLNQWILGQTCILRCPKRTQYPVNHFSVLSRDPVRGTQSGVRIFWNPKAWYVCVLLTFLPSWHPSAFMPPFCFCWHRLVLSTSSCYLQ